MDRDEYLKEKLDMMNPERVERDKFLDIISHIESSGGQNFDHPEIQSGIHEGDQAIGRFGLMPNTVKEMINRSGVQRSLASEPSDKIKQILEQNPEQEYELADQLARKVLDKQQDPEKAAYSWFSGHNLSPEQVDKRDYLNSDYVQKFKRLREKLGYK